MSTLRVLLISPPYSSFRGEVPVPAYHLGLLYLAAFLKKRHIECSVFVCDLWAEIQPRLDLFLSDYRNNWDKYKNRLDNEDNFVVWQNLRKNLKDFAPNIVGITSTTPEILSAIKVAQIAKSEVPDAKIVFGGPHGTLVPDDLIKEDSIDFIIRGEGEIPFYDLIREIHSGRHNWKEISSLTYVHVDSNGDRQVVHNKRHQAISDLDLLPFPSIDSILFPPDTSVDSISIIATRGCVYRCAFCAGRELWGKVRKRNPVKVVDEIEQMTNAYPLIKDVYFNDGTLTYNENFITQLCDELIRRNLKQRFYCTARFDNITEQLAVLLKKAGFVSLYLGAESGDEQVLKRMKKGIDLDSIEGKIDILNRVGIASLVSILVGVPGETEESLQNTIGLMKRLKASSYDVNTYVPLPGSEWYRALVGETNKDTLWMNHSYKGGDSLVFKIEKKEHLNKYIDQIYHIADDRLQWTIERLQNSDD